MELVLRAESHSIKGINYFNTPEEAIALFKEAPLFKRVYSCMDSYKNLALQAVFKACSYTFFNLKLENSRRGNFAPSILILRRLYHDNITIKLFRKNV